MKNGVRKHWAKYESEFGDEIRNIWTREEGEEEKERFSSLSLSDTNTHIHANRNTFAPHTGGLFWIICHSFLGFACYSFSLLYLCAHKYIAVALQFHQNRLHAISLSYCFPKKEKHSLFSFRGSSGVHQCRQSYLKSLWISNLFRNKTPHGWHANGTGPSKCTRTSSPVLMKRTRGDWEMSVHTFTPPNAYFKPIRCKQKKWIRANDMHTNNRCECIGTGLWGHIYS